MLGGRLGTIAKSLALGPPIVTLQILRIAVPESVMRIPWTGLVVPSGCAANVSEGDDRLKTGAVPVPVNRTVCGLLAALSAKIRVASRLPAAVGMKVTPTEHELVGIIAAPEQVSGELR